MAKKSFTHYLYQELMQQELEVLANVNHPNIMRIYELLEDKVNYYVVTELLSGGELFDYIIKYKKFE